jgi:exosortase
MRRVSRGPALLLLASLVLLYGRVTIGLVHEWVTNPDASHGIILSCVALAIAWSRRHSIVGASPGVESSYGLAGLGALVSGLVLFLLGQFSADIFITRGSLVVVLAGLAWYLTGWRAVRALVAPLAFLAIAIPLPALIVNSVTLPMQLVASRMAETMLSWCAVPVFRDGNVLVLPSAVLQVAEACSGLRSVISLGAIGLLLMWAADDAWWRRLGIVALTVPIAIALNAVRIAVTGLAVEQWGPDAASGGWHTFAGWTTFVAALAILLGVQRMWSGSIRVRAATDLAGAVA